MEHKDNSGAILWFAEKGLHINKLIARRPQTASPEQVELAAHNFFDSIEEDRPQDKLVILKSGEKVKYIDIAWRIWEDARELEADEYALGQAKLISAAETIQAMDDKHRAFAEDCTKRLETLRKERANLHETIDEQRLSLKELARLKKVHRLVVAFLYLMLGIEILRAIWGQL